MAERDRQVGGSIASAELVPGKGIRYGGDLMWYERTACRIPDLAIAYVNTPPEIDFG